MTKNTNLLPTMVAVTSKKKVWWVFENCNHNYEETVSNRYAAYKRSGSYECPFCSGKKILSGLNDLATLYPEISSEWHPTKNDTLPNIYSRASAKKAWWLGACGHEWEQNINARTIQKQGCPFCVNVRLLQGFNDLLTRNPEVLVEWDYSRNTIKPEEVLFSTSKKAWWKCEKGHEWEAKIASRAVLKTICTRCSYDARGAELRRRALESGSLQDTNPEIAEQWHPTKNEGLTPFDFVISTRHKAWWQHITSTGEIHEWEAAIVDRARLDDRASGCLICANKFLQEGMNDLLAVLPYLETFWDYARNKNKDPRKLIASNGTTVHLICLEGHRTTRKLSSLSQSPYPCKTCVASWKASQAEMDIAEWCKELGFTLETNTSSIKGISELDIYIPDKNFAIEFNGLYWHTEEFKPKDLHYTKYKKCLETGIELFQIWEDDWNEKKKIVEQILLNKLGISAERKLVYEKTSISEISKQESDAFLNRYSLQGQAQGNYYLGLKHNNQLEAVMVLSRLDDKTLTIGGFSTSSEGDDFYFELLLQHIEDKYKPNKIRIIDDNACSFAELYKRNNFKNVNTIEPDYSYFIKGRRITKTEYIYEDANKLHPKRIWDAGKTQWEKLIKTS